MSLLEEESRDPLLTPGEVAKMMRVTPKTVSRWCADGWLPHQRTLGGHRRIRESEARKLLAKRR